MSDLKKHTVQRLCSARHWLVRAEESFDRDHSIRGELDLLLAQAELQRARETKRFRHGPMLLQGLAFACAAFLVIAGVGSYCWLIREPVTVARPNTSTVNPPMPVLPGQQNNAGMPEADSSPIVRRAETESPAGYIQKEMGTPAKPQAETVGAQMAEADVLPERHSVASVPAKQVFISTDEKQKLIREAGKTLRGN